MRSSCAACAVLLVTTACTNDYGGLDFTEGLSIGADGGSGGTGGAAAGGVGGVGGGTTGGSGGGGASMAGGTGPTGGTAGVDAGPRGGSAGLIDGGTDAQAPDAGAPDATAPGDASLDASPDGPVEGGSADAADGADASRSCDDIFSSVAGYVLCSFTATDCTFAVATNGGNCTALCASSGEVCLAADDNDEPVAACVVSNASTDCETYLQTQICTCSR